MGRPAAEVEHLSPTTSASIRDILAAREIVTFFQPILSARQRTIVGVEALSRGVNPHSGVIPPRTLFRLATESGVATELDRLCREEAMRAFAQLGARAGEHILFLNLHIPITQRPEILAAEFDRAVAASRLSPTRVAVEILEAGIEDMGQVGALVDLLRARGFLIVLDDVGSGHSNLDRIPLIKPDLIKIDRTLIANLDADYHKRGTLKSLVDLGRKIGALVVAEGVETEGEAMVALELGADLLQGYVLGRPRDSRRMSGDDFSDTSARIDALAIQFRGYVVEKINARKLQNRRLNVVLDQFLYDLTSADAGRFDAILSCSIQRYPNVECVYVLDDAGMQVTETVCNPAIRRRQNGILFHPAALGADHSLKEYYYILLDVELRTHVTDPYVSLATGSISQTISTSFRDARTNTLYVLCIDVLCE